MLKIDGYIKGSRSKNNIIEEEEDKDIEEIQSKLEFGKPKLVKDNKKEAV